MSQPSNLQEAERKVFRTVFQDGLWDLFLGCFMLMFAVAPLLSVRLGDFWASVVFLPFWGLVALAIWLLRRHVIAPRVGVVKFGEARKRKLHWLTLAMLSVNVLALVLGIVFALRSEVPGQAVMIVLGLILLVGFNIAAYLLDFRRLHLWGLLVFISPIIGEWLFTHHNVSHHGLPITFGITSGIMILTGMVLFFRLLRDNPPAEEHVSGQVA